MILLICIEGLDRTGKTTLANQIVSRTGATYMHCGAPTKPPLEEYIEPLLTYQPGKDNVVLDRHYLGETVWPGVFGRPTLMDAATKLYIEMFLQSRGALLVYATRDLNEIVDDSEDEPVTGVQIAQANWMFEDSVRDTILPYLRPDDARDAVELVISSALRVEEPVPKHWNGWVGSPTPHALLVSATLFTGIGDLPYSHLSPASYELLEAIDRDPQLRGALAIARFGVELNGLVPALGSPPVIALSEGADAALEHLGIIHQTVKIGSPTFNDEILRAV